MYEDYYGFLEPPFSLTPDARFLYKSHSHDEAFELLWRAISRREAFIVVTGDIGTGKTTLCRAILDRLDPKTFTALILNPFVSEEDLLKVILQEFGVVSRNDVRGGRLGSATKQELVDALQDFLLSLVPLDATAVLIIDEAQNLPLQVLEQIRILSNLETYKTKLLQIVLVGQLNLETLLASPELRQLDQRVSTRCHLGPLNREEVEAYIAHRLWIARGGLQSLHPPTTSDLRPINHRGSNVSLAKPPPRGEGETYAARRTWLSRDVETVVFAPRAIDLIHRASGGVPRVINLLCDKALTFGYEARTSQISPQLIGRAAQALEIKPVSRSLFGWARFWAVLFGFKLGAGSGSGPLSWVALVVAALLLAAVIIAGVLTARGAAENEDARPPTLLPLVPTLLIPSTHRTATTERDTADGARCDAAARVARRRPPHPPGRRELTGVVSRRLLDSRSW